MEEEFNCETSKDCERISHRRGKGGDEEDRDIHIDQVNSRINNEQRVDEEWEELQKDLLYIFRFSSIWSQIFSSHNISSQDYLSQQQLVTITNRHMTICHNDSLSQEILSQIKKQLVTTVTKSFLKKNSKSRILF